MWPLNSLTSSESDSSESCQHEWELKKPVQDRFERGIECDKNGMPYVTRCSIDWIECKNCQNKQYFTYKTEKVYLSVSDVETIEEKEKPYSTNSS